MKETTLYVVRHGQTEWNLAKRMQGHKDSPLTKLGREQAQGLCTKLLNEHIDIIYCSDSKRACDTAEIIKGPRSIPVVLKQALKEINLGHWEGLQHDEIINNDSVSWGNFWNDPQLYIPTEMGESYQQLQTRVIPAVRDIINAHQGKTILIVTHQITTKMIMSYFQQKEIDSTFHKAEIAPASLSKISIKDRIASVLLHGDISHYR